MHIPNGWYHDIRYGGFLLAMVLLNPGSLGVSSSNKIESITVATITGLTVAKYLCYKWPRICSVCRNDKPVLFSGVLCIFIQIIVCPFLLFLLTIVFSVLRLTSPVVSSNLSLSFCFSHYVLLIIMVSDYLDLFW